MGGECGKLVREDRKTDRERLTFEERLRKGRVVDLFQLMCSAWEGGFQEQNRISENCGRKRRKWSIRSLLRIMILVGASQVVLVVKNPPANAGDLQDTSLIPGLGRSPGRGHGNTLQYSCLENPHEQKSLAGYSPLGLKDLDMAEWLSTTQIYI